MLYQQQKMQNQFIMSNYVMKLGLSAEALAIYCYLMYIEDRDTYQCYPSYKTIGEALNIKSVNTVRKYVQELEDKCLIYTERTVVILEDGTKRNGNLKYTIRPIQDAVECYYQNQIKKLEEEAKHAKAQEKIDEYNKKYPKANE